MIVSLRCDCAFFLEKLAIIKCCLQLPENVARQQGTNCKKLIFSPLIHNNTKDKITRINQEDRITHDIFYMAIPVIRFFYHGSAGDGIITSETGIRR